MSPVPRTFARLLTALACSAGLVVTGAGFASASDLVHIDPARDARSGTSSEDRGRPAPLERRVDVRRVSISHGADAVTVRIRTRGKPPRKGLFFTVALRTPSSSFEATYLEFLGADYSLTEGNNDVECPGFTAVLGGKVTTATIPTSCIGAPDWIRAGVGIGQVKGKHWVADDGLRRGIGDNLRLSRRIARD